MLWLREMFPLCVQDHAPNFFLKPILQSASHSEWECQL